MGHRAAYAGETWLGTRKRLNVRSLRLLSSAQFGERPLECLFTLKRSQEIEGTRERNIMYLNQPETPSYWLQMFLDVDCRDLKYTYAASKEVEDAAQRLEHKLRG